MNRLQKFTINKLFGYQDVNLKFKDRTMILMGENGLGKTSILNSLYFSLTKRWRKLSKINFESIEITIDNIEFIFTREELMELLDLSNNKDKNIKRLESEILNLIDIDKLKENINSTKYKDLDKRDVIYDFLKDNSLNVLTKRPISMIIKALENLTKQSELTGIKEFENYIEKNKCINILYFPTYRRVEEELHNIGKLTSLNRENNYKIFWHDEEKLDDDELEDETLIQFGMEDVEQRIKNIITKINDSSIKGFAKVTGEMLHQLQEGFPELTEKEIFKINRNNIEIILNRVKNNLSEDDRINILRLLDSRELLYKKELAYFLIKLEGIYLQQRELDNSIKNFEKICNEYLVGKKLYFDESSVTLNIFNSSTKEKVELSQLSSGEKQVVSIFSKLYLEDMENQLIFFDEPELSLSMKWQRQLLPHVLDSGKCEFLLAVTHSPFIFDNELEKFAIGMNTFIE